MQQTVKGNRCLAHRVSVNNGCHFDISPSFVPSMLCLILTSFLSNHRILVEAKTKLNENNKCVKSKVFDWILHCVLLFCRRCSLIVPSACISLPFSFFLKFLLLQLWFACIVCEIVLLLLLSSGKSGSSGSGSRAPKDYFARIKTTLRRTRKNRYEDYGSCSISSQFFLLIILCSSMINTRVLLYSRPLRNQMK